MMGKMEKTGRTEKKGRTCNLRLSITVKVYSAWSSKFLIRISLHNGTHGDEAAQTRLTSHVIMLLLYIFLCPILSLLLSYHVAIGCLYSHHKKDYHRPPGKNFFCSPNACKLWHCCAPFHVTKDAKDIGLCINIGSPMTREREDRESSNKKNPQSSPYMYISPLHFALPDVTCRH